MQFLFLVIFPLITSHTGIVNKETICSYAHCNKCAKLLMFDKRGGQVNHANYCRLLLRAEYCCQAVSIGFWSCQTAFNRCPSAINSKNNALSAYKHLLWHFFAVDSKHNEDMILYWDHIVGILAGIIIVVFGRELREHGDAVFWSE